MQTLLSLVLVAIAISKLWTMAARTCWMTSTRITRYPKTNASLRAILLLALTAVDWLRPRVSNNYHFLSIYRGQENDE